MKSKQSPLILSYETKSVTLDYPMIKTDLSTHFEYLFGIEEYTELKEFFKKFGCIKNVRVNYGEDFDMTEVAVWVDFDYSTPDKEVEEICNEAIKLMEGKGRCDL